MKPNSDEYHRAFGLLALKYVLLGRESNYLGVCLCVLNMERDIQRKNEEKNTGDKDFAIKDRGCNN